MDLHLADKVAIVTGAASGIGRATAKAFASEGSNVILADINEERGREATQEILENDGQAAFIHTDVGVTEQVRRMIQFAVDTYGGLDILHNNAYWTVPQTAVETTEENWHRTLDVTLKGPWLGIKFGIPEMLKRGGGVIVNTASTQSIIGEPQFTAYQAAKGGMMALTRQVALDYGPEIRINAVLPGTVETPALYVSGAFDPEPYTRTIPLKRVAAPEEIATVVLFLASDMSSYMTGQGVVVDGGFAATIQLCE